MKMLECRIFADGTFFRRQSILRQGVESSELRSHERKRSFIDQTWIVEFLTGDQIVTHASTVAWHLKKRRASATPQKDRVEGECRV
jgi:hypothetical protein